MTPTDLLIPPLRWLDHKLPCFDPMPSRQSNFTCLKAFAELAIAVMYLREYLPLLPSAEVAPFLNRATTFLTTNCDRSEYLEAARLKPQSAYAFLLPYLSLRALGHRSPAHEDLLRWLTARNLLVSAEMSPYRALDRMHFLCRGGVVHNVPWRQLYRETTLARRPSSIFYTDDDAYSVTHTIFYLTDFGLHDTFFRPAERASIADLLHALLLQAWRAKNWDLMGEVLACLNFLHLPASALSRDAASALEATLRPDGTLPPHASRKRRSTTPDPTSWDPYSRDCYHPTLVYLLYALSTVSA